MAEPSARDPKDGPRPCLRERMVVPLVVDSPAGMKYHCTEGQTSYLLLFKLIKLGGSDHCRQGCDGWWKGEELRSRALSYSHCREGTLDHFPDLKNF